MGYEHDDEIFSRLKLRSARQKSARVAKKRGQFQAHTKRSAATNTKHVSGHQLPPQGSATGRPTVTQAQKEKTRRQDAKMHRVRVWSRQQLGRLINGGRSIGLSSRRIIISLGQRLRLTTLFGANNRKKSLGVTMVGFFTVMLIITVVAISSRGGESEDIAQDTDMPPQSLGITDEIQGNLENIRPVEEVSFRPYYPEDFDERGIEFVQQMRGDTEYVTYIDSLDGTNFTVTQQLVTEEIVQAGDDQVENLARAMPIPATGVIQIDDTTVFVGISEQNRQALLFTKENVLLFIRTEGLINESSWVGYITRLINGT